ncbi:uncharacterized protein KY384_008947 [Bacidia gigantensis]|uniref:uncharacterized protein n=1 Tax=Bacidia gigantensis TaxID=2732470 RepID=UPI001D053DB1|nr:uncharacterized protein KY384_008947 [Bacidia gigantensis]KAG8525303.1 hypothetical protein KY384_008947 [Bacidia gigantensis]
MASQALAASAVLKEFLSILHWATARGSRGDEEARRGRIATRAVENLTISMDCAGMLLYGDLHQKNVVGDKATKTNGPDLDDVEATWYTCACRCTNLHD